MKRLVSAFLAGAMALSLAACGGAASTSTVASSASASGSAAASETAASDLDYIKEKGKMVIGYTVYEPMNYTDADGNLPVLIPSWQLPCAKAGSRAGVRGDQLGYQGRGAGCQEHRLHLERYDPDR